ncbi:hypothetical protein KSP40_PGU010266 [Platanthera guangdongensis]|uniref:Uncharacterized protein n=1 Tax=Platanthera guangdongensis TaxID=2320717 RepID=A0ABR2LWF1_9ASPA
MAGGGLDVRHEPYASPSLGDLEAASAGGLKKWWWKAEVVRKRAPNIREVAPREEAGRGIWPQFMDNKEGWRRGV